MLNVFLVSSTKAFAGGIGRIVIREVVLRVTGRRSTYIVLRGRGFAVQC